jgi:hypothetical protein
MKDNAELLAPDFMKALTGYITDGHENSISREHVYILLVFKIKLILTKKLSVRTF